MVSSSVRGRKFVLAAFAVLLLLFASATGAHGADPLDAIGELEVESYARDYKVSKAEAEQSLRIQMRGAALPDQLRKALGEEYAGVWFDNEAGEFVVPILGEAPRRSVDTVLARDGLADDLRTAPARASLGDLENAQEQLDDSLASLIDENLVQTSIDPAGNVVVVYESAAAEPADKAQVGRLTSIAAQRLDLGTGLIRRVREGADRFQVEPAACNDPVRVCDAPLRGGVKIEPAPGGYCTAAFKAIGNSAGNRFMLTAGHCTNLMSPWKSRTSATTPQTIGSAEGSVFPGHDYGKIKANGSYWDKPSWPSQVAVWGGNQGSEISWEGPSYVGQYVCHSGAHSGSNCGTVTLLGKTVNYPEGTVNNLTVVQGPSLCVLPGDSGGPVFAANVALGIFSGRSGGTEVECGTYGYYNEVTEASAALGVTVGPPVPPQPSWHYENLPAELTGEVGVSSWGNTRLDVFARGANNNLYHRWWNLSGWSAWENMGGNLASGPDAVSWGTNRIDVVAEMQDESVGHWSWDGAQWAFDNLGGQIKGKPSISSRGFNSLDVFARGTLDHLYQKTWTGTGWIGWTDLGGTLLSGPDSVSWGGNRIDVVARTGGDVVGHWYGSSGVWGYDTLGGVTYARPAVSSWGENRLDVFVRGADSALFHKYFIPSGWSAWEYMGGNLASGPDAVSWGTNRIDVVAQDANNTVDHWWWGT